MPPTTRADAQKDYNMAMTLKLDTDGRVVVQDGKPVYTMDDGKDIPFDAAGTVATITRLNAEAKGHREGKEAAETKLKAFEGLEDPEAAKKAMELVKNIKDGELIAAGRVEEIKKAAQQASADQLSAMSKAHAEELGRVKSTLDQTTTAWHGDKLTSAFSSSKFIADNVAVPADLVQAKFASNFKVEPDGKLYGFDATGAKIYSRTNPGEPAAFDEALGILVDGYPARDNILKGNNNGGAGIRQNGPGGAKTINRSSFEQLQPAARAKAMADGLVVVD